MTDPTSTVIQQNQYGFAPQLAPYAEDMLGQAAALSDTTQNPYMQYQGDRVAQFSPLQQMSYDNAALMQSQPQLQDATATAGLASLGALNTGYTYNPYTAKSFGDTGVASSAMNPYMQNVVDIQQREAQRQADIASTGRQADHTSKGAVGGSRAAIMDSEAARNLALQKGDIQAQGLNSAYGQAQHQFNTEQQARQAAANLNARFLSTATPVLPSNSMLDACACEGPCCSSAARPQRSAASLKCCSPYSRCPTSNISSA